MIRPRPTADGGSGVEVHCFCPPDEAARRYDARGLGPQRHRVHTWTSLPDEVRAEYDGPIGVGTVIEVDTVEPVDVEQVAARVRAALGQNAGLQS